MAIQEKLYTVDDVWRLAQQPENEHKHFYLIDGELFGIWRRDTGMADLLDISFATFLNYAEAHDLGDGSVESAIIPAMIAGPCSVLMSPLCARKMPRQTIT